MLLKEEELITQQNSFKKGENKNEKKHRRTKSSSEFDLFNLKNNQAYKLLDKIQQKESKNMKEDGEILLSINKEIKNENLIKEKSSSSSIINKPKENKGIINFDNLNLEILMNLQEKMIKKKNENKYSLIEEEDENLEGDNKNSNGQLSSKKSSLKAFIKNEEKIFLKNEINKHSFNSNNKNKPLVKHMKNKSSDLDNKANFFLRKMSEKFTKIIDCPKKIETDKEIFKKENRNSKIFKLEMEIKNLNENNNILENENDKISKKIKEISDSQVLMKNKMENKIKIAEKINYSQKITAQKFEEFFNKIDYQINLR